MMSQNNRHPKTSLAPISAGSSVQSQMLRAAQGTGPPFSAERPTTAIIQPLPNVSQPSIDETPVCKAVMEQFSQFLHWNNSIIYDILEKNQILEENILHLQDQIDRLKQLKHAQQHPRICRPLTSDPSHKGDAFIISKFGGATYRYALAAIKSIPKQLYKQRNFNMTFKLVDSEKNTVVNCNPIPVSLCLFESTEPYPIIEANKSGKPIFKGNSQATLYHGRCQFRKVHIRQVTSYYPNGWIYGVLAAKEPPFAYTYKQSSAEQQVDFSAIKPLVVSHIVVRAKKK